MHRKISKVKLEFSNMNETNSAQQYEEILHKAIRLIVESQSLTATETEDSTDSDVSGSLLTYFLVSVSVLGLISNGCVLYALLQSHVLYILSNLLAPCIYGFYQVQYYSAFKKKLSGSEIWSILRFLESNFGPKNQVFFQKNK